MINRAQKVGIGLYLASGLLGTMAVRETVDLITQRPNDLIEEHSSATKEYRLTGNELRYTTFTLEDLGRNTNINEKIECAKQLLERHVLLKEK